MAGSGTLSTRTSRLPYQVSAFISSHPNLQSYSLCWSVVEPLHSSITHLLARFGYTLWAIFSGQPVCRSEPSSFHDHAVGRLRHCLGPLGRQRFFGQRHSPEQIASRTL